MNYDFIYSLASEVVFMESKKIDKEGIKTKTTELGYKGKKYDELRKVFKLKAYNLIQANHGIYKTEDQKCLQPKKRSRQTFPIRKLCLRNYEITGNWSVMANFL